MNTEYENIIKQVVSATFCNRLTEEEACEILCSLYRIASSQNVCIYPNTPQLLQQYYTNTFKHKND